MPSIIGFMIGWFFANLLWRRFVRKYRWKEAFVDAFMITCIATTLYTIVLAITGRL